MENHIPECFRTLMENQIHESLRTSIYGKSPLLKKLASLILSLPNLWLNLWQPRRCFLNCTSAQSQTIMQINLDFNFIQRRVLIWSFSQCVHSIHHITINSLQKSLHQFCFYFITGWVGHLWWAKQHDTRKPEKKSACMLVMDLLVHRMSAKQITLARRGKDKMR